MTLDPLYIGDLKAPIPIIQGGMGIGVSRSGLAAAVANCGGVGVISGVHIGFDEPDFESNPKEANIRALRKHIRRAKELSPNGVIGLNLLAVIADYDEYVAVAVEEKIDLLISGAGLPLHLPKLVEGSATKIAPIVSSAKAAQLIAKTWDKKYGRIPDLVILEGPLAGGHLGFSPEQLEELEKFELKTLLSEVLDALKPFEEKYEKSIPVVGAGGIFSGEDIRACIEAGAAGVQMATRFVATVECDADPNFKLAYVHAKEEDLQLVKSPVGLPGRALRNAFVRQLADEKQKIHRCHRCLKPCNPGDSPYCISRALINAVTGHIEEGLIFSGSNSYRIDKILPVKELMEELIREAETPPHYS